MNIILFTHTSRSTFAISAKRNGSLLNSGWVVSRVSRSCRKSTTRACQMSYACVRCTHEDPTDIEPVWRDDVTLLLELQVSGHPYGYFAFCWRAKRAICSLSQT